MTLSKVDILKVSILLILNINLVSNDQVLVISEC